MTQKLSPERNRQLTALALVLQHATPLVYAGSLDGDEVMIVGFQRPDGIAPLCILWDETLHRRVFVENTADESAANDGHVRVPVCLACGGEHVSDVAFNPTENELTGWCHAHNGYARMVMR